MKEVSPYVSRIKIMWEQMRGEVIKYFPHASKEILKINDYLKQVQENFKSDAYF
jgi:hypothetical protein